MAVDQLQSVTSNKLVLLFEESFLVLTEEKIYAFAEMCQIPFKWNTNIRQKGISVL